MGPLLHRGGDTVRIAYELLRAAFRFAGQSDFEEKLNHDIATRDILPANVRTGPYGRGRSDIWRDYQQVLAELGLIYSTRFHPEVLITPIGLQLISGAVGFSEVVTSQALRYQYPNGQKEVSPSVRNRLPRSLQSRSTQAEIDALAGVKIKPGVMLLRLLCELLADPAQAEFLKPVEVLEAVVPFKTNAEWPQALKTLIALRKRSARASTDRRRLRHIQEWFRWLGSTDLFQLSGRRTLELSLSRSAAANISAVRNLCAYHEDPAAYWVPTSALPLPVGISWFDFYGSIPLDEQWFESHPTPSYIERNFPGGLEPEEGPDEEQRSVCSTPDMTLLPFSSPGSGVPIVASTAARRSPEELGALTQLGIEKRLAQTKLHEDIVRLAADKLTSAGYVLSCDRSSVDLLAQKSGTDTILEVKTVTARNLVPRIRLGVGQLSEYRYRRSLFSPAVPIGSVLVMSSGGHLPAWLVDYFSKHIKVGLVGLVGRDTFRPYTGGAVEAALSR